MSDGERNADYRPPYQPAAQELELSAGDKRIKIRGSDIITLIGVAVMAITVYMLFEHKKDAKDATTGMIAAVKEMTATNIRMVEAQREMNCLIALPQERREREFTASDSFCKRISRER